MACHNPHRLRHHMPLQVATQAGKPAGVPAAVLKRFPHLAGCTALLIPDNILRQVDLVCTPDAPQALSLLGAFGCNPSTATLTGFRTRLSHCKPCGADALVEHCMLTFSRSRGPIHARWKQPECGACAGPHAAADAACGVGARG